jgi:mRNA interferase RelE/StbE
MSYTVLIERSAQKQLAKISSPYFESISEKILLLEKDPRPPGCKKLTGRESWRIRVGDYRIIYNISDRVLQVIVIDIGNRKEIYR